MTARRHLHLLGAPHLLFDGVRVTLPRRKALALLAYLAATGTPHTRASLATLLWGDSDDAAAHAYLRNALWTLSKAIGADWLSADSGTVALNPAGGWHIDSTHFAALAAQAQRAAPNERDRLWTEAAHCYVGRFLDGFHLPDCPEFDHWQTLTAQSLERTAHSVFAGWAESLTRAGDLPAAIQAAQRWAALDALHEPAQRALMRLYASAGEAAAAQRQYRELARRLREELRTQPDPATTALYEQIMRGELQPISTPLTAAPPMPPEPFAPPRMASAADPSQPIDPLGAPNIRPLTAPTFLLGRETERAELMHLLSDPLIKLVTIVGAGGMGKTRLAEQMGADAYQAGLFPDGAYFVNLAPLCADDAIASTIAHALPYTSPPTTDAETGLFHALRGRRVLLVIDNCEHVIDGAPLFSRLLEAAPDVKILATSRERLTLRNERVYELRGLFVPNQLTPDSPIAELFALRARQVTPNFALTADTLPYIARIARLVEGMPLGIELAAAWTPLLSPALIASEIQRSLDFLAAPTRDIPERHRSLRAVFESSWAHMTDREQQALARLSVFRGGFTLDGAAAAADASLPTLLGLVSKSLIRRTADNRYELHELLRQFADNKLTDDDRRIAQDNHARYIAAWLTDLLPLLLDHRQSEALDTLQADIDNVRIALRHAIFHRDAHAIGAMIDPLALLLAISPRWDDFPDLLLSAAEALGQPDPTAHTALRGRLMVVAASAKRPYAHTAEIDTLSERAAQLLADHAADPQTATAWIDLGVLLRRSARVDPRSEQFIQRGLTLFQQVGLTAGIAYATYQMGVTLHMSVRYQEARTLLLDALHQFELLNQPSGLIGVLDMLSENAFTLGLIDEAYEYWRRQLEPYERLGMLYQALLIREEMAEFFSRNARLATDELLEQVLTVARETGNRRSEAWALYNNGWLKWLEENYEAAAQRLRDAHHLFETLGEDEGIIWTRVFLADVARLTGHQAEFERWVAAARQRIAVATLPWGEAGLEYVLGDAALAAGDLARARNHYQQAIRIAHGVHAIMQTLRHLTGIADVWIAEGHHSEALTLTLFILAHSATWEDTHKRLRPMIQTLQNLLDDAQHAEAQARAVSLSLDDAVQLALADAHS